jgi:hypothetical protein
MKATKAVHDVKCLLLGIAVCCFMMSANVSTSLAQEFSDDESVADGAQVTIENELPDENIEDQSELLEDEDEYEDIIKDEEAEKSIWRLEAQGYRFDDNGKMYDPNGVEVLPDVSGEGSSTSSGEPNVSVEGSQSGLEKLETKEKLFSMRKMGPYRATGFADIHYGRPYRFIGHSQLWVKKGNRFVLTIADLIKTEMYIGKAFIGKKISKNRSDHWLYCRLSRNHRLLRGTGYRIFNIRHSARKGKVAVSYSYGLRFKLPGSL